MIESYLRLVANDILPKVASNSVFKSMSSRLSAKMLQLADTIRQGISKYGIIAESGKDIFAYEVDGRGNYRLYDDSNLPSLLSLPYLKYVDLKDSVYQNTRKFILSEKNRFFYARRDISGVGSSHTDERYIWPLALITQILTSTSNLEIKNCLNSLVKSAKDDLMHESFSVDNPN